MLLVACKIFLASFWRRDWRGQEWKQDSRLGSSGQVQRQMVVMAYWTRDKISDHRYGEDWNDPIKCYIIKFDYLFK